MADKAPETAPDEEEEGVARKASAALEGATVAIESRVRPIVTAALVGGLTGAALAGVALLGGRLVRRTRARGKALPPE